MNWWLWLIVLWVILGGLGGAAIAIQWHLNKPCGYDIAGHVVGGCLIGLAVILTLVLSLTAVNRSVTSEDCHNWGAANSRAVRFASYTFWDYGCVTPAGNGHWIPTDQITVNNVTVTK